MDTVPSHEEWRAAMLAGPGGLALAAGRLLGAPAAAGLRELGAAYGVAGALRNVAALARAGRCLLPEDLLAQQGASVEEAAAAPAGPSAVAVMARLSEDGHAWLANGRGAGLPRRAVPAALVAVLARRDLGRAAPAGSRGLGDRLAVLAAAMTGRV